MKRVLVIGCAGSGRSRLARQISEIARLPLVHLDRQFWGGGLNEPDTALWTAKVDKLIAEPEWVMVGDLGSTLKRRLDRADTAILLDHPRRHCLWRLAGYGLRRLSGIRGEPPAEGSNRLDWRLLRHVWRYRKRTRPDLLKELRGFRGILMLHQSPADVAHFLSDLRESVVPPSDGYRRPRLDLARGRAR